MAIEIVDFPINSMVIFHGKMLVHQRVILAATLPAGHILHIFHPGWSAAAPAQQCWGRHHRGTVRSTCNRFDARCSICSALKHHLSLFFLVLGRVKKKTLKKNNRHTVYWHWIKFIRFPWLVLAASNTIRITVFLFQMKQGVRIYSELMSNHKILLSLNQSLTIPGTHGPWWTSSRNTN